MNRLQKLGLAASTTVLGLGIMVGEPAQAVSFKFEFDGQGEGTLSFQNSPLIGIGQESISLKELDNLAEDLNFEFYYSSSSTFLPYGIDFFYSSSPDYPESLEANFYFTDGSLTGIDFTSEYNGIDFNETSGPYAVTVKGDYTFLARNDRFIEFFNGTRSAGSFFDDCYYEPYVYTDSEGNEIETEIELCRYTNYESTEVSQIQQEGLYSEITTINGEIFYSSIGIFTGEPTTTVENRFLPFNEWPQITFTTLEPINPNQVIESIPESQPFNVLGLGTAIAFGAVLKKVHKRKTK